MPNALKDHGLLIEAMTRARNTIICVTNPNSKFNELFQCAVNHNAVKDCDFTRSEGKCTFIGPTKLLEKDEV